MRVEVGGVPVQVRQLGPVPVVGVPWAAWSGRTEGESKMGSLP